MYRPSYYWSLSLKEVQSNSTALQSEGLPFSSIGDWCSNASVSLYSYMTMSPISLYNLPGKSIDLMKGNCATKINKFNERKWSHAKKARSKRYPAETITDADHADDLALLANTQTQGRSLLHGLLLAARVNCLYVNSDKTEFVGFKHNSIIY